MCTNGFKFILVQFSNCFILFLIQANSFVSLTLQRKLSMTGNMNKSPGTQIADTSTSIVNNTGQGDDEKSKTLKNVTNQLLASPSSAAVLATASIQAQNITSQFKQEQNTALVDEKIDYENSENKLDLNCKHDQKLASLMCVELTQSEKHNSDVSKPTGVGLVDQNEQDAKLHSKQHSISEDSFKQSPNNRIRKTRVSVQLQSVHAAIKN
jgi:hypothetical protein